MPDTKGIILFDCDGTLVDTELLSAAAISAALAELGIDFDENAVSNEFIGVHLSRLLPEISARFGKSIDYATFVTLYVQSMHRLIPVKIRILDDTRDYIAALHARGYKMGIGSNGVREIVLAELEATNILQYFDVVVTADDVANPKPAPDMYLEGMRALGGKNPESVHVLEDSVAGLLAAKAAGMIPVGYVGLSHSASQVAEKLKENGAIVVLDKLSQLDLCL